ncbi:hypothetical protein IWQ60_003084 [Tieghemiomyces parasiticus]|uniref:Uncharacterized protein n=1 Tax=Tieghemiomyces parasiticus TaxID=78921 RepID=A0A9W8AB22_9FUNG|nr:hypothetical protein IWQ60_003084 [Tieghemiomyces parasiticus]
MSPAQPTSGSNAAAAAAANAANANAAANAANAAAANANANAANAADTHTLNPERQRFEKLASEAVPAPGTAVDDMTDEERILAARAQGQHMTGELGEGRLPNTRSMTAALDQVHLQDQTSGLSPDGQRVAARLDSLAEVSKKVLQEKNPDDQLQKSVYHATQAGSNSAASGRAGNVRGEASERLSSTAHVARRLQDQLTDVARLTVTSSAFRRLLGDMTSLFQEVVGNNVQDPDKSQKSHVSSGTAGQHLDDPATHQSTINTGAPSNLNAPIGTDFSRSSHLAAGDSTMSSTNPRSLDTAGGRSDLNPAPTSRGTTEMGRPQHHTGAADRELTPEGAQREAHDTLRGAQQPAIKMGMDAAAPYAQNVRNGDAGVRETGRQMAGDLSRNAREGLHNVRLSPEQRERLTGRFQELMREVQTNPDYQRAVEDLLSLLGEMRHHLTQLGQHAQQHGRAHANENPDLHLAVNNARQLIENFANGYSTKPLYDAVVAFFDSVRHDDRANSVLRDNKHFVLNCLRDHQYIESEKYRRDANELLDRNREVFQESSRMASATVGREVQALNEGFRQDPTTRQWTNELDGLFHDLFLDEQGKPTIKANLVNDAVKALPELAAAARFVPLPRLEASDEEFEYAVDNLVISLTNILPNNVTVSTRTDVDFGSYGQDLTGSVEQHAHRARERAHEKTSTAAPGMAVDPRTTRRGSSSSSSSGESSLTSGEMSHTVAFDIRNVVCTAHNAAFYFKKKTGFPKMSDSGYADLEMNENKGLDLHVVVRAGNPDSPDRALRVVKVQSRIRSLKLKLRDTKHDIMYKVFSPIINSTIRHRVQKALDQGIRQFIANLDQNAVRTMRSSKGAVAEQGGSLRQKLPGAAGGTASSHRDGNNQHSTHPSSNTTMAGGDRTTAVGGVPGTTTTNPTHKSAGHQFDTRGNADGAPVAPSELYSQPEPLSRKSAGYSADAPLGAGEERGAAHLRDPLREQASAHTALGPQSDHTQGRSHLPRQGL